MKKTITVLWVGVALLVLFATLYFYDGRPFSDIWIFLTLMMLVLSFPAGLLISLGHSAAGTIFSTTIETTYVSLTIEWTVYFITGYLQWFRLAPYLFARMRKRLSDGVRS